MKLKNIIIVSIITIVLITLGTTASQADAHLTSLDFEVKLNDDGSMDVTETWDIQVSNINTLYKTFVIDSSKYSSIENVKVKRY